MANVLERLLTHFCSWRKARPLARPCIMKQVSSEIQILNTQNSILVSSVNVLVPMFSPSHFSTASNFT